VCVKKVLLSGGKTSGEVKRDHKKWLAKYSKRQPKQKKKR